MQYHKFVVGETIIEFNNNWLGEEKVMVNGQLVSKKSSTFGTNHHFNLIEDGKELRYVLTSKLTDLMQVALDLRKNGVILYENVIVRYGSAARKPVNKEKKKGMASLQEYELEEAIIAFEKALDVDRKDPEIWFHLACAHSVMENIEKGFECLEKAIENKLTDTAMILKHEMLAYLRIQNRFDDFMAKHFK